MSLTAPYAPPPVRERRRRGGVIGPLVLIFIGAVFLLENTGYLPPNFWVNLWRLWPVLLVLAGIELMLAHRIPWIVLAGLATLVLIVGAVAVNSSRTGALSSAAATTLDTSLGDATQAAVTVRFGAGELNLDALPPSAPGRLATMSYNGPPDLAPRATSIRLESGAAVSREDLLARTLSWIEFALDRLERDDPAATLDAWTARSSTIGAHVRSGSVEGVALRLAPDGGLVVRADAGAERTIRAGDVVSS